MNVSEDYRNAWESYWQATSDAPGEAIWDSDPSLTAVPHSELLLPHADSGRTIVDLGCGNGTQTRYLATRFARAVGVDLSHAAIEHARRAGDGAAGAFEFQQLDLTDTAAVGRPARPARRQPRLYAGRHPPERTARPCRRGRGRRGDHRRSAGGPSSWN